MDQHASRRVELHDAADRLGHDPLDDVGDGLQGVSEAGAGGDLLEDEPLARRDVLGTLAVGDVNDAPQPRIITIVDRKASGGKAARRMADPANEAHISAPMPGVVATLGIAQGQQVKASDLLLTLEAMKMETAITAPRDGAIAELVVKAGQAVDAKELLMVMG